MSTEDVTPVQDDENESNEEVPKVKRLPRSAKKRLRYERLRQQYKQAPKKKKKSRPSFNLPSSDATETVSLTGKLFKRTVNERLAEINRETTTPVICIDCAYNESMSGKEIASLARQIGRCYSSNRRAPKPVRLTLTNWSNESPLAQECRRVNSGFENYQIILCDKPIHECHPSDSLIYLSPNGDKVLTEVNEQNVYVIGGLVDESVRKNMTFQTCQNINIACYRLPIETYMEHSADGGTFNQILTINQVFDILQSYMTTQDWGETLKKHVPERKGWVVKKIEDSNDNKNNIETV
ncbi:unnamed protein product [Adineta ricciae]|uniref:SAM-dependent MTase TRM10-type domain-containing protein n=1 Tax=Adineta ricciae TaxID=249248 RepID=A0A814P1M3_ADIRI|nr:unnamed protein product [Adineta ricciae]CAF1497563.1 unnamed protein product [Adineta ricciae]